MLGRSQGESEKTKNIQKSWKNSNRCSAKVTTVAISRSDLRHRWRLPPASAFWPRVPLQLSGMELIFPYQHMDIEKKVVVWKKKSYPSSIRESKITLYLFESSTIVQKPFKKETAETPLVIRALLSTLVFCIDHRSKAQSITCTGSWSIWSSREYKSSPRVLLLPIFLHTWSKAKIRHHVET